MSIPFRDKHVDTVSDNAQKKVYYVFIFHLQFLLLLTRGTKVGKN